VYSIAWNPSNTLDSIGYQHNLALDHLVANRGSFHSTLDQHELLDSTTAFFNTLNGTIDSIPANYSELDRLDSLIDSAYNNNILFTDLLNVPTTIRPYLDSILGAILVNAPPNNVVNAIKGIEDNIAASTLSQNDKEIVLGFSSIAKFSTIYWNEQANNTNSEWHDWQSDSGGDDFSAIGYYVFADVCYFIGGRMNGNSAVDSLKSAVVGSAVSFCLGLAWDAIGSAAADVIGNGLRMIGNWLTSLV
jgi:hypothetical protein